MRRPLLLLAFLAPVGLLPATAWGQDVAAADALFNKAIADMDAGRYDAACPALAESQHLDPRSGTLFAIASCNAKAGKIATASAFYGDYLRSVADLPAATRAKHADRMKIARVELDKLRPQIPTLKLVLPASASADGAHLRRDGTELSAASLGIALPIDPGPHLVTLEVPGRAPAEHRFSIERGQTKVLELGLGLPVGGTSETTAPTGPTATALPPSPSESNGRRLGAYVAGGAGVALVVVGAVTGGLALGKKSVVNADCAGLVCNAAGEAAVNAGKTLGTVSTVGFALGAAGVAAGAVLFFTAPKQVKIEASAGPGSLSASFKGVW